MDDALYKLEHLSLVNKIAQEINNHTGLNDSTIAEFVINIHEKSKTKEKFQANLKAQGAEFPPAFVDNLDRLILAMDPKYKKKKQKKKGKGDDTEDGLSTLNSDKDKKLRMFPGLALPDQEWKAPENDKVREAKEAAKDATVKEVDDLLAQLEGVAAKKSRPAAADYIAEEPAAKRQRRDDGSRSPPRGRRRSPTPPRDNGYGSRGRSNYEDSRGRRDYRNGGGHGGRPPMDTKAVLYKIYDGKVTNLKDFGAFVQLDGISGNRVEGM